MAGTFTIGEKKVRPGVYHRRENYGGVETAGALNGVGAATIRSNWGPLGEVVDVDVTTSVSNIFGNGQTVDTVTEMFRGGCITIYTVRVGTGGSNTRIALQNEDNEEAVTLTAKYVGDRSFTVTVRDSLLYDNRECIIYEGTSEFEKVSFQKGGNEAEALAKAFAASSSFVAKKVKDGILANITQVEMAVGTNPTVAVSDYSNAFDLLEPERWNVLCVDTSELAVHTLVHTYLNRIYETGSFPMACIAETKDIPIATRMQHAAAYNDEKIVFALNPARSIDGTVYDGYKLAARIGGMIASKPANEGLTHEVVSIFAGLEETLTNSQIIRAIQAGCLCLSRNDEKQIWIEYAINTLLTPSTDQDEGWKKIRRVKTRFELMDRVTSTIDKVVGKVNNDTDGRGTIIAAGQKIINLMVSEKKLIGGSIYEDPANPPEGDSCWFLIEVDDIDSAEKIYLAFRYRFSPNA